MLTLSGCKFEIDICPAIHLVNKQIFGTFDFALSVIHITGTHTAHAFKVQRTTLITVSRLFRLLRLYASYVHGLWEISARIFKMLL